MPRTSRLLAIGLLALLIAPDCVLFAGHTRPAYLDGCQSMDGRYVVTGEPVKEKAGKK